MDEFLKELGALMAASFNQGAIASQLTTAQEEVAFHQASMDRASSEVGTHYFKIRELMNIPIEGDEPTGETN